MPKTREQLINEIRDWKQTLSSIGNIPKKEGDVYERLHTHLKSWVENIFGLYTDAHGTFRSRPEGELSEEAKEWRAATNGKLSVLYSDWYEVALKGQKDGWLPAVDMTSLNAKEMQTAVKEEVNNAFFPAYRALRDSFSRRSIFEWFYNHRQYVAERDALKVMTNLITSMTGFTKRELDREYEINKQVIGPDLVDITKAVQAQPAAEVKKAEEVVQQQEEPEVKANLQNEQPKVSPEEEIINDSASDKFEKLNDKKAVEKMTAYLANAIVNTNRRDVAVFNSVKEHIIQPFYEQAKQVCNVYDALKGQKIKDVKPQLQEAVNTAAEKMFEVAFKALNATHETGLGEAKETHLVLGVKGLRSRIINAQRLVDVMLRRGTPVGFKKEALGELGKGNHILENTDKVISFIKETYGDKYSAKEIDRAVKSAKNEFGALYRGKNPDMSYVYDIGYRPNPDRLQEEQKALGMAQKLVNKGTQKHAVIEDDALKQIINKNIGKWKVMRDSVTTTQEIDWPAFEEQWQKTDETLNKMFPEYDPEQAQKVVEDKTAERQAQKKMQAQLKKDLKEADTQVVPPVDKKPVQIDAPKAEK